MAATQLLVASAQAPSTGPPSAERCAREALWGSLDALQAVVRALRHWHEHNHMLSLGLEEVGERLVGIRERTCSEEPLVHEDGAHQEGGGVPGENDDKKQGSRQEVRVILYGGVIEIQQRLVAHLVLTNLVARCWSILRETTPNVYCMPNCVMWIRKDQQVLCYRDQETRLLGFHC